MCSDYNETLPAGRHSRLAVNDDPKTGSSINNYTNWLEYLHQAKIRAATYAEDCTTAMRNMIVQHNETYAAQEQFMTCTIKKQGRLGVEAEIAALATGQNI